MMIVRVIGLTEQTLLRSAIFVGLLIIVIAVFQASFLEAGMRNLAFIGLVKHFAGQSSVSELMVPERTLKLFAALAERDPSRYQPYHQRLQGIRLSFLDTNSQHYLHGRRELEIALQANVAGNKQTAKKHFRRALEAGTQQVQLESRLHLAALLSELDAFEAAEEQIRAIVQSRPPLSFGFDGCPGTTLLGGYIDQHDISWNLPVHVLLIWQKESMDRMSPTSGSITRAGSIDSWHWYEVDQLLFQVGSIPNLLQDGGFERTVTTRVGLPPNLSRPLYRSQLLHHTKLRYDSPSTMSNMVLTLNGQGDSEVGVGGSPIPIQDDISSAYLFAGRYQTVGAAVPRIGARWILEGATEWADNLSEYAVTQPTSAWTQFSELMLPPENAEYVQFWALNADPSSRLSVDDLALLRVPLPCVLTAPEGIGS
jgi:hypothetical protein